CTWPSLNRSSIGIERTWYFSAVARFSSTLTLAIFTLPAYSSASSSRAGAIILQGPHQGAQKSTSTGSEDCSTLASKSASVAWKTCTLTKRRLKGLGGPERAAAVMDGKLGGFAARIKGHPSGSPDPGTPGAPRAHGPRAPGNAPSGAVPFPRQS